MFDLRSLEVFFWVVKLGGFGRAAERLHMTQPAVSARIGQIETRLNVRLLDRGTHRPAAPTPKGLELFAYAERMLALQAEALDRMTDRADLAGVLRLGVAETLVHTLLGPLLRRLHDLHPCVTPEVTVDISPTLKAGLLSGELDTALLMGPVNEPRVCDLPLCEHELIWVASPDLALDAGPLDPRALAAWPILSYARGTAPHAQLSQLFSRPDLPPVRLFANSSLASIVRMAVDGIGIGILPAAVVRRELADATLRRVAATAGLPPLRFTASYLATPGRELAAAAAALAVDVASGAAGAEP